MSSDIAISVRGVSKHYLMFERPEDRLKQMVVPRLQRAAGMEPTRYFRDFAALQDISFDVRRGETMGIVGRNGCGKSTLLQIVCGTLQPSSGSVDVNGRIAALLELGAGFNTEFTGRENVYMNAAILGLSREETDARFDDIARFADIGMFIDQPVKTYSSGMYVRLAFAVAINVDPDILVVDEALAVGDEAFQRKCFARIEDIKAKGGTILFVSHGAQTIVQLCDRAMLLDRGEKILEGRPKTVVGQYQRFVNLTGAAAEPVREEISAMDGGADEMPRALTGDGAVAATPEPNNVLGDAGGTSDAGSYDPGLQSQSRVEYECCGARIHDISLMTATGRNVNVLKVGDRYALEFVVDFEVDAARVNFGFALRTVDGLTLAGAVNTDMEETLIAVAAGDVRRVRYEFVCRMLPGKYFLGCTVYGSSSKSDHLMHRIVDALMIAVQPERGMLAQGILDLSPSLSITKVEAPNAD